MRELGSKMAELKFEAPLAKMDETDDWAGCDFISNQNTINDSLNLNLKDPMMAQENKIRLLEEAVRDAHVSKNGGGGGYGGVNGTISPNCNTMLSNEMTTMGLDGGTTTSSSSAAIDSKSLLDAADNFSEAFGGSLEDLVNTFDEKITKCFGNFEENVEALAPVQVRSQDEIMNECQMWWTITGNFGNILPIDWSKSYTRKMHMPTLNLGQNTNNKNQLGGGGCGSSDAQTPADDLNSEDDEAIANDLDMHALILHGLNNEPEEPIKSVEEVIKEIEYIIDEAESPTDEATTCESEVMEKAKEVLGAPLYAEKLQYLSINQLNELYMEMEVLIQELSETLINELALRDELEFEKELKNSFISILLAVQNKRRQYHVEKKRGKFQGPEPKYLTTVIPYTMENGTPNNQNLQVLIKILKAINEDSPTVPTLLTDYILKVLCPT
ncbi:fasciculation and elongation protein zeta-2 [Musca vetustissima]|uniref:fasciculation and elongation protein zeta-2 n=1 Tax=Musca vetustissima TaxID=27455 RepID=UPI002AB6E09D|nr:fasciculation and elongation protein zeta-2 [Musca vetustissima]